jgi:hypothetical protein
LGQESRLNERAAAGAISFLVWQTEIAELAGRVQAELEAEGRPVAESGGSAPQGSGGWPALFGEWWFWVFVAPEAAGLVLWLLWLVLAAPVMAGAGAWQWWRKRRRRSVGPGRAP